MQEMPNRATDPTPEEKEQFRRHYKTTLAGQGHALGIAITRFKRTVWAAILKAKRKIKSCQMN